MEPITSREIVRAAADKVRNPCAKSWLFCDERGTWGATAGELLDALRAKYPSAETEQRDDVIRELSDRLALAALTAVLEDAKKRQGKKRGRASRKETQ